MAGKTESIHPLELIGAFALVIAICWPEGWGAQKVFLQKIWRFYFIEVIFVIICYGLVIRCLGYRIFLKRSFCPHLLRGDPIAKAIILILAIYLIYFGRAMLAGRPFKLTANDFRAVPLMLSYFVGKSLIKDFNRFRQLFLLLCLGIVFHSLITLIILPFRRTFFAPIFEESMLEQGLRVWFRNSALFILPLPFLLAWVKFRPRLGYRKELLVPSLTVLTLVFLVISAVISQSRMLLFSILLTLVPFLGTYRTLLYKHWKLILALVILMGTLSGVIVFSQHPFMVGLRETMVERVRDTLRGEDESLMARLLTYHFNFKEALKQPLWGHGVGAKMTTLSPYLKGEDTEFLVIDNLYITVLYKMGVIGLIAYLILLWSIFTATLRVYRRSEEDWEKLAAFAILSSLPSLMIYCTVTSAFLVYTSSFVIGFFTLLGGLMGCYFYGEQPVPVETRAARGGHDQNSEKQAEILVWQP